MSLSLFFHNWTITSACDGLSEYEHSFGGPPAHAGAQRKNCNDRLLHLLHRINLEDPLIGLHIPRVQWLPLYYCFDFRVNAFGYHLSSDEVLRVYFWPNEPNTSKTESYPDKDFPRHFAKTGITLASYDFDPTDRNDAYDFAAVFGLDKLSPKDRAWVLRKEADACQAMLGYRPETEAEVVASLSRPFGQGRPDSPCPNPDCKYHKKKGHLQVIALVPGQPVPGVHMFGRWGDGVQLIYELCPNCHTIHVSNQCD
jgi:hypothetical protein